MENMLKAGILTLFLLLAGSVSLQAQDQRLVPDRPGFSTGTFTVPVGEFYIETGYQYSFRNSTENRVSEFPQINIRTGLTQRSELFVSWDGFEIDHNQTGRDQPLPSVGGKFRLVEGRQVELTLLGVLHNSREDGDYRIDPLAGVMWEIEITDRMGHFGGIQLESELDENRRVWNPALAAGIGFELFEKLDSILEWYTIYESAEKEFYSGLEAGFLFYPNPSLQIDLFGGLGLSDEISHYLGVGLSIRL